VSAVPSDYHLDVLMGRAVAQKRGCGGFYAYIRNASHVAYAYGEDHQAALAALRKEVAANWLRVLRAIQTIEGKEAL